MIAARLLGEVLPTNPKLFTISPAKSFVDALAAGLLETADGPAGLMRTQVFLPTRRACRSLREAFLRLGGGRPMLLPRMTPLGDIDEDDLLIIGPGSSEEPDLGSAALAIPPAAGGLKRQLILARLISARGDATPDQAVRLAAELARLLDQVHTERLPMEGIRGQAPEEYSEHWQQTLKFLEIVTEVWPKILEAEGLIDAAERRNRLLDAQSEQWRTRRPDTPIVIAGTTGSIPATADLLKTALELENGVIVLPGLDRTLSDEAWTALEPQHPQFGLARLLSHLDVGRGAVADWPGGGSSPDETGRAAWVSRALAPEAAGPTADEPGPVGAGEDHGVAMIECPTQMEEAGVIALAIREALETPGKTVALVTPDRQLARRVTSELGRWRIEVDDSAGQPVALTAPGVFLRLTARVVAERFAPVSLLSTLKHPLASGGMATAAFRSQVRKLEAAVLRGPRPAPGLPGLREAISDDAADLVDLFDRLATTLGEFETAARLPQAGLPELLRAHVAAAEGLAASDAQSGAERLWAGDSGEALAMVVAELAEAGEALGSIAPAAYPALIDNLLSGVAVRPRYGRHARVHVWGLLEARLQRADLMILGGLNEGTWPPEAVAGPWMSRPMMKRFGLALPERRIGLTAHDFTQALGAPEVLLTRAGRVDGTPTVPSRWLLLLDNDLKKSGHGEGLHGRAELPAWFRALDKPAAVEPAPPPMPAPPLAARPRSLSVTRVETWIRDPYAIYADKVLGLSPLDPLDADPGAAERGTLIHEILERFVRESPGELPADAFERLVAIGGEEFEARLARPGVRAFWWPRFLRIAEWFVAFERRRRADGIASLEVEAVGKLRIETGGLPFHLTAKADRIDGSLDGSLHILDYKTGQVPSGKQVETGLAPQLPLEAAMATSGAFPGVGAAGVSALAYIRLSGGRVAGEERVLDLDPETAASAAFDGLQRRIRAFDNPKTPYRSRPRPMFKARFGDYDHLARVKEWSSVSGDDE